MTTQNILSEKDLEEIFLGKRRNKTGSLVTYITFAIIVIVMSFLIYFILNFPAMSSIAKYWYQNEFGSDTTQQQAQATVILSTNSNSTGGKIVIPQVSNNVLSIASLNLKVPITWRVPNEVDAVSKGLQNGAIQIDGTSLPGQTGNVFVTAHSSNYAWAKGNYNSIFALLNNLVVGDVINLKYQDQNYVYTVSGKKIISSTEVSVMDPTAIPTLTLSTCWPIGTAYKRLIITAPQTYPNPSANTPATDQEPNQKLPATH